MTQSIISKDLAHTRPDQIIWAWRRRKDIFTKVSLNYLMNDGGVCKAAPGFARV